MKITRTIQLLLFLCMFSYSVHAQEKIHLKGIISSEEGEPLDLVSIGVKGTSYYAISDPEGKFNLECDNQAVITLQFSRLGYLRQEKSISPSNITRLNDYIIKVTLIASVVNISEVVKRAGREYNTNLVRIDPRISQILPDASGSFEGLIKKQLGVTSSNELSSQYSVRGGNYDENLVYVNDIQIYRPLLIRSGQQEGLSFINSDMVSSVLFSAGGFEARYGDKMSSVLDIRYKKPSTFAGSAAISLMGGSLHLEGSSQDRRLSYITGLRYKTNKFLLNTLDTKGDYNPRFTDFQTYISYDLTTDWEFDFLANIAHNNYRFVPETGETSFGTVSEALKLTIYFDGMEQDAFTTYLGAFSSRYHPNDNLELKFILSAFQTNEKETFDIQGQYWLNQLDNQLGSDNFADSLVNVGVGTFLDHARNRLQAKVISANHKGFFIAGSHQLNWGIEYQRSQIADQIEEWIMMDSAGYSLPYSDTDVHLFETYFASASLSHQQITSYFQDSYKKEFSSGTLTTTAGLRASYQDVNNNYVISPRASLAFAPSWENNWTFSLSGGAYHQPPFFKEFRDLNGMINPLVTAQKSMHILGGSDLYFTAWERPFKFVTELYYKYLWDLIPYEIDNVRIRYYGDNMSNGYAAGLDMKINGEFVPGVESWASVSIMKTQEDIIGDTLGFIDRPTDQRVNVAIFFQDFLPNNKSYKAHLNLLFGTGLPYGPPGRPDQKALLRIPPYRRVDLGFSKVLIGDQRISTLPGFLKHLKNTWISLEVFNLLDINNTISHIWIRDISNRQYSIPNYLTGRRINLKLQVRF
ncbi:MAG: TonB-dependent receptor [Bacteroidetes bacterium]|nr:TonB-dependent receptor [Bacteroidota bacterium]MBT4400326.1 TonB-dependent receptor [Bacteroidota bacterium]MBT4408606.1 TonB-dependent receptor [Bacteroidota bacterium]MBT7092092.1 TonB-dependent receptor [Bacteroidota bacterium]MBT7462826.1 TonB-dependent receptor [Bacteroidota bacterium]